MKTSNHKRCSDILDCTERVNLERQLKITEKKLEMAVKALERCCQRLYPHLTLEQSEKPPQVKCICTIRGRDE